MIVRKYGDDSGGNLEVFVAYENIIVFQVERDNVVVSVDMCYEDAEDLRDRLYDLIRLIKPVKKESNG